MMKSSVMAMGCSILLLGPFSVCLAGITCREVPGGVEIRDGETLLLRYNTAVVEPPAGIDPVYRRSGHIHPLNTPAGHTITAEFPEDHAHQHGVFFAWVNTKIHGHKVDFWNQAGKTGTVVHAKLNRVFTNKDSAGFSATLHHLDLTQPEGSQVVLEEEWTLTAYPPDQEGYQFDLVSRQTCVAHAPLVLLEYHYGGMAFRGTVDWLSENDPDSRKSKRTGDGSEFLTSEGKTRIEGNHSRPNWVNLQGKLAGDVCGVTIFCHPNNWRAPQPVRLHPSKPYFVFSPEVLGDYKIFPGESLVSRYRFLVQDGPVNVETNTEVFDEYSSK